MKYIKILPLLIAAHIIVFILLPIIGVARTLIEKLLQVVLKYPCGLDVKIEGTGPMKINVDDVVAMSKAIKAARSAERMKSKDAKRPSTKTGTPSTKVQKRKTKRGKVNRNGGSK